MDTEQKEETTEEMQWFVMRDLKRPNALRPAYIELSDAGFEVFTPLRNIVQERNGIRKRARVPFISDLLFVHSTRSALDPVVNATPTLQYRFARGAAANTPMVVHTSDMTRFICAVNTVENPLFYTIDEISPKMLQRHIRIVGGQLDGYEGILLTVRGSKKKRLLVEIPGFIAAAIEVEPQFIQLV